MTHIAVSIPPRIADLTWTTPHQHTADAIADATEALVALERCSGACRTASRRVLVRTEAIGSSRIESIETTADEYGRAHVGSRASVSALSVVAAADALIRLVEAPVLDERSLLEAHERLMREDPIDGRSAGRYREVQNWIGGGRSPRDADHVPPPPDLVPELMADLFAFLARDDIDPIAQAAIGHAQFESIHPFTDGNGRVGRMLVAAGLRHRRRTTTIVVPIAAALAAAPTPYFARPADYRDGATDDLVVHFAIACAVAARACAATVLRLDQNRTSLAARYDEDLADLLDRDVLTEPTAESFAGLAGVDLDVVLEPFVTLGLLEPITARRQNRAWNVREVVAAAADLDDRVTEGMLAVVRQIAARPVVDSPGSMRRRLPDR